MAAAPEHCVVIEDSVAGVRASVAARIPVIGFSGGGHCRPGHAERLRDAGASAVCDDMRSLPALVSAA
jgi:beta-phosphoglucomutase-like phosphatase (HAD superfamily)